MTDGPENDTDGTPQAGAPGQPMQPVEMVDGVARFKENGIVGWLFRTGRLDMFEVARRSEFTDEDRMQIAQQIGYSVSGFGDLAYATDGMVGLAETEVGRLPGPGVPDATDPEVSVAEAVSDARPSRADVDAVVAAWLEGPVGPPVSEVLGASFPGMFSDEEDGVPGWVDAPDRNTFFGVVDANGDLWHNHGFGLMPPDYPARPVCSHRYVWDTYGPLTPGLTGPVGGEASGTRKNVGGPSPMRTRRPGNPG